ncbi:MAG: zinc ribbon domain-containing protein [Candidatus Omnitrophica bacterium]|nr:zinc ribbon domain-containing protein [Candidatus Omnitrophota bacterium]
MFCTKCGSNNPDTSKFCVGCGAALGQAAAPQAPAYQPPPPPPPKQGSPVMMIVVVVVILAVIAGAAFFFLSGKKGQQTQAPVSPGVSQPAPGAASSTGSSNWQQDIKKGIGGAIDEAAQKLKKAVDEAK